MSRKVLPSKLDRPPELKKLDKHLAGTQGRVLTAAEKLYTGTFHKLFPNEKGSAPKSRNRHPDHLVRHLAALYYATDPHGCTREEMHEVPLFAEIPLHRMIDWSVQDNWVERRKEYWRMADELVIRRVAEELTNSRMHDLRKLEMIWQVGFSKLVNNTVPASSWEGVCNSLRMLTVEMDALRVKVAESQAITPPTLGLAPTAAMLDISDEEAREAALYLLDRRQRQQQAALEAAKDVTGEAPEEEK